MADRCRRTGDRAPRQQRGTEIPLDQEDVYDYLSGAALGFKSLPQAMGDDLAAATPPIFITGSQLFAFRPEGEKWWDYLDEIWDGYEKAEALDGPYSQQCKRARMINAHDQGGHGMRHSF